MPDEPTNAGSPEDWLRHSLSDLRLAMAPQEGVLLELFCFHAQQAVEKASKAVLVHHGTEVPRTHNTGLLLDLVEGHRSLPESLLESARLTVYSVETRYPAFGAPVQESEYRAAIRIANEVVRWVEDVLNTPPAA